MSRSYYYTVASLPMLTFGEKSLLDSGSFLLLCKNTLHQNDYKILKNTKLTVPENYPVETPESVNSLILDFWSWDFELKNALVKERSKRLNIDGSPFLRGDHERPEVDQIASHAVKYDSPLEAEKYISKSRWNYIESLGTREYFGLENIQVWYLHRQIIDRLDNFDSETGLEKYRDLYDSILSAYEDSRENTGSGV